MQILLSSICLALTSVVIGNAYYQKKQFYPAVVYITKSNASMAVIYIQFFVIVFMFGKLLRKIFLGTLRAAEFEHLLERFWYALTETCLAFTVFRDDFNPRFVALFTVLLFLKSFHWLAEERVDFMERSPVLGWLFHIRVASLLVVLGVLDYFLLMHAYNSTLVRGPTVQLVFGFEYAILLTVVASTAIKYVLHAAEMRTDVPWENKAVFLLYTELVIGMIKVILYVLFVVIMAKIYALPMFVFRPMFFTIRNFKKALSDVIMSRRAIRNMNTLYPDATPEELRLSDNICIICREDMVNHSKKLPCGHIFHTTCLRSWFQRQQTCPTCRLNILRTPNANSTAIPRPDEAVGGAAAVQGDAAAAGAGPAAAAAAPLPNQANGADIPRVDGAAPPNAANIPGLFENIGVGNVGSNIPGGLPSVPTTAAPPNFPTLPLAPPFMMPPPFPFIAPYAVPPPPMPSDLSTLSDEELKLLEGNERRNVEERIKLLRNIELMLNAAGILMNNYQIITARLQPTVPLPTETATSSKNTTNATVNNTNDGPSTSAAAAAALAESQSHASRVSNAEAIAKPTILTENSTHPSLQKYGDVTIEDLGGEEHEYRVTHSADASPVLASSAVHTTEFEISTDDKTTNITAEQPENAELSELRKRRLKFLEEVSKLSTPTTTTNSENTSSD
ncbi:E3 ubiquitin-protein ligase HRD1 [Zeugodacus cucurbitae]|uniref:RING-type E3 ubiquitin transferase n=1 Tax=Zeugodacus cucurbitae TaxID=28588 RepID=A0A0A1WTZ7_ZEUCU|nr:E3 ubiquitin-protein ligase HRD1 [Zeugodacus cucurbitae]XP_054092165.1 E3 ubiquitin-protein ligase HRD1 [Zeugodacus cucurbitae]XP_054092166.1 E3 ubiquitin-protein ligase HRD1 [Zeugodacus cucurbitae]